MRQGDRLTSLISAGPPCQADKRKLFIPKLKWDVASYHSHCIHKVIIYGACGQKQKTKKTLNNESGLTVARMGSSTPGCTLCAFFPEIRVLPLQHALRISLKGDQYRSREAFTVVSRRCKLPRGSSSPMKTRSS